MAYVRRRGNQIAIVHGEREPGSGKVQQLILFTLYSKKEALEAIGRGEAGGGERFESLLRAGYPEATFNWKRIRQAVAKNLPVLPDHYEYGPERLIRNFRSNLCAFARQLILADPQELISAARLIQDQHRTLEYVADLIQWRLQLRKQEETKWNAGDQFYWRYALRGGSVPMQAEEHAADYFERGDYDMAEAVFELLIECFDGYAEGHNYLGLIALERRRFDEAIAHFEKTIELGRPLFPKRISKKWYWTDHRTRPYMRGLRNLALSFDYAGRYEDALSLCARLEEECDDHEMTGWLRGAIYLNTGRWLEAVNAVRHMSSLDLECAIIKAFGLHEIRRAEEALISFLHVALNCPRTVQMLTGTGGSPGPRNFDERQDHNMSVSLLRALHGYLARQSRSSKRFFRSVVRDPRVMQLQIDARDALSPRNDGRSGTHSKASARASQMRTIEFAREKTHQLLDLVSPAGRMRLTVH